VTECTIVEHFAVLSPVAEKSPEDRVEHRKCRRRTSRKSENYRDEMMHMVY
jgi:hypothetical protein